jgi:peptidyl-tRNA hydrolase, PTH2 family
VKQVIVVNEALDLPRGKLAAQVAHAALAAFLEAGLDAKRRWLEDGMPKVVLRVDDEDSLLAIEAHALRLGLPTARICDAGHTVVEAGTLTCIGIGPAEPSAIDPITGTLKLVR